MILINERSTRKKILLVAATLTVPYVVLFLTYRRNPECSIQGKNIGDIMRCMISNVWSTDHDRTQGMPINKKFLILYYNPSGFIVNNRKYVLPLRFEKCEFNNCDLTFDKTYANKSDAIIYDGIFMPKRLGFTRPLGQIWIFAAHEPPTHYHRAKWWYTNKNYIFNWTMTYNKDTSDIYLPYGEIRKHKRPVEKDFTSIALGKKLSILMIVSNCKTSSKRQDYVKMLKRYIDIKILGLCGGARWSCGRHYHHNDTCFQILNAFKFYLAFENSFCNQYFSEKFYENFNYDTIMLTRGGSKGDAEKMFPEGTYIATDEFKSIQELAWFLRNLTVNDYAKILQRKSQFYSTGFKTVYQRSLCDICQRLNFPNRYQKTIKDIRYWAFGSKPCLSEDSVDDIH